MFAYLKGSLEEKSTNFVVIDVGGVGYKVFMSASSIDKIGELGNVVKVHTHYHVREDDISLYGFLSNEELKMFELLLSVSGIGAKSAITMLSNITPSAFAVAVISNDIKSLTKIPGVGTKSAQRIVLELKDKLKNEDAISKGDGNEVATTVESVDTSANSSDAFAALIMLGYSRPEVNKAIEKIDTSSLSTEDIIKVALKYLAR
ncbi:MAG: Holliday junction branch migration protein RuvA [Clostridia bacterium]|nr:Holliday junction branch migration protein RuvA [Clostridia bacterium]